MNEAIITRAEEIVSGRIGQATFCVLGQPDIDGYPTCAAITVAKHGGIRWFTFGTGLSSNKVKRVKQSDRATVCFCSEEYNITLVGKLEVITDQAIKDEMWYKGMENHFKNAQDPDYCVLRFVTERYNLLVDWQEAEGTIF